MDVAAVLALNARYKEIKARGKDLDKEGRDILKRSKAIEEHSKKPHVHGPHCAEVEKEFSDLIKHSEHLEKRKEEWRADVRQLMGDKTRLNAIQMVTALETMVGTRTAPAATPQEAPVEEKKKKLRKRRRRQRNRRHRPVGDDGSPSSMIPYKVTCDPITHLQPWVDDGDNEDTDSEDMNAVD